ncbi:MAG: FHA domain-containing protein [Nannocystaceae bacterium]|nr:FHA domain-containing protein [Nannocystaceae bacterium]
MAKKGETDLVDGVAPELDIESQLDDIAAALNFDLDDEDSDEDGDEDGDVDLEAAAKPFVETEIRSAEASDAVELDDLDVEEIDSMQLIEDFDDLEEDDPTDLVDSPSDTDVVNTASGPLYLEIDGEFAEVNQERFVIGRVSKMCDLAIIDVNVSRQHCAIERRDDGYYIVDLGSTNGVLLNDEKTSNHRIAEGEEFVLSSHRIRATFLPPDSTMAHVEAGSVPAVTGRMQAVPAEPEPQPVSSTQPVVIAPIEAEPLPAMASVSEPSAAPPAESSSPDYSTFEQRVEMRLEQLAQQLAYVQQQNQALMTQVQQLQGVANLAQLIQQRLAARGGKL